MDNAFIFVQNLKKRLESEIPGAKFESNIVQPIRILEPQVVLEIREKPPQWKIISSTRPTLVRS